MDGTIYFGSDYSAGSGSGSLYAFNPDGTQKWIFDAEDDISSSPAIGLDGTIYVGSDARYVYAINPDDGTQKWRYYTGGGYSSPAIGLDSTIYVGSMNNRVYALAPDGSMKWSFNTGATVYSSPLIGADGTIYVGCYNNNIFAINSAGEEQWVYDTGRFVYASPAMGKDGTVYIGNMGGTLFALNSGSPGLANAPWPKFHQNNQNTGLLDVVIIVDKLYFAFVNEGSKVSKNLQIINATAKAISINSSQFGHSAFSLMTTLPTTIPSNSNASLVVNIQPETTALHRSSMNLNFTSGVKTKNVSTNLAAGMFLEDNSETTLIAHQAYEMYEKCKAEDENSIATKNNLGVVYRLLGEPGIAEKYLQDALSQSLNKLYGYDGISLNVGVTQSDMNKSGAAKEYYDFSLSNNSGTIKKKTYYNLAWEAYIQDSLAVAADHVQKTLVGSTANEYLKAKAYVLRGAIRYRQGDVQAALSDFNQAIALDPDGPIARIAEENVEIITSVEETAGNAEIPTVFVLMPNYPNPFNPETMISFGIPVDSEVELLIYNVLGQKVRNLYTGNKRAGWHNVRWDGNNEGGVRASSGVYILQMKAGEFKFAHKMTLLR